MHIITGGTTNHIDYSCMYNPNFAEDFRKEENGRTLYGLYGIADSLNDAPAILWFDTNMNFVKGEILKKCVNCQNKEKDDTELSCKCLHHGFQIKDEMEEGCEEICLINT